MTKSDGARRLEWGGERTGGFPLVNDRVASYADADDKKLGREPGLVRS